MFFWNSLAFSMIQQMLAIWSLIPLPFLNVMLKPSLKDFEHNLTGMGDECNCPMVSTFFGTTLGNWDED